VRQVFSKEELQVSLARATAAPTPPVQLLPPFDPYLMGHASRDHAAHRRCQRRMNNSCQEDHSLPASVTA
jgi:hypothetical protein